MPAILIQVIYGVFVIFKSGFHIYVLNGKLLLHLNCSGPKNISLVVKSIQEAETVESWNRLPRQGTGDGLANRK